MPVGYKRELKKSPCVFYSEGFKGTRNSPFTLCILCSMLFLLSTMHYTLYSVLLYTKQATEMENGCKGKFYVLCNVDYMLYAVVSSNGSVDHPVGKNYRTST